MEAITTAALVLDALRRLVIDVRAWLHRRLEQDTMSVYDAAESLDSRRSHHYH